MITARCWRELASLLTLGTVALMLSCDKHAPTQPDTSVELQIVVTSPALPATAAVGTTVPPVSVQVLNKKNGQIIYNEPVSFVVTAGGGTVYAPTVQTDNMTGIAQDLWTLGTRAGFDTLQARVVDTSRVGPLSGSASVATFRIQAVPLAASVMSAQAGNGQTAIAGSTVAVRPAVLVTDRFGNPIAGVTVTFAAASGGGTVGGASQPTNASGIATVGSWTLGATAGQNTLTATATGLSGSPVTFTATGINAAANQLIPATSTAFTGTAAGTITAATGPAVRVVDQNNNGVPNVPVTFTITGPTCPSCTPYPGTSPPAPAKIAGVASVTVLTDANGRASGGDWTLSTLAGANTLQATAVGLSGSPVTFTATGTAGAAALLFKKAGDGQSASVGAAVTVAAQVTDVYGNPFSSGTQITFAVQSGGGSIGGVPSATVTTDVTGGASVNWTLGATAGSNALTATRAGLTGSPATFTATATGPGGLNITNHAGDAQTAPAGTTLPIAPAAQVTDQTGHPVAGVTVTFSVTAGGGSIAGATQLTNANGIATVGNWTLGPMVGVNELQAAFNTGASRGYTMFVATATRNPWTAQAPLPTPRNNVAAGVINGLIYVVGGCCGYTTANEAYDPAHNTWSSKARMPIAVAYGGTEGAVVNGVLYLIGGNQSGFCTAANQAYNPATDTWAILASMPTPRCHLAVVALNGLVYAIGGTNTSGSFWYSTVEVYNPSTNSWSVAASMPTPRSSLGAGVLNGLIYVVGGSNPTTLSTVEAYNPATNSWSTQTPMPTARSSLGVGVLGGKLYAIGGGDATGTPLRTNEAYDAASGTWSTQISMPTPRFVFGVGVVTALNAIYAVGGSNGVQDLGNNEAFTP